VSVEVNPVGLRCGARNGGLSCTYCYQVTQRAANAPVPSLDLAAVKRAVEANGRPDGFTLFGGEALLAPVETLEALWAWGLERYGRNGVQTSGRPIREEHYALFHRYRVNVAFSIDGPGALNDARRAGSTEQTRAATAHACEALERCVREKLASSVIVTLHRLNASADVLHELVAWVLRFADLGVTSFNFHLLERDGAAERIALTDHETVDAVLGLWEALRGRPGVSVQPVRDILALLRGVDAWKWNNGTDGGVGCTWTGCDPWTTPAVYGVEADGSRSLCQRVHKTPTSWLPAAPGPLVRQLALRATPQEDGGCQGCRQMITCKGQCPGTAEGGDWRRRSRDCAVWKALLEHFEGVLVAAGETPVTLRPDRDAIEARMAEWWEAGRAVRLVDVLKGARPGAGGAGTGHGDHTDHGDSNA
jgi:uncharacterized protein